MTLYSSWLDMDKRLKASLVAGVLFAGGAAFSVHYFKGGASSEQDLLLLAQRRSVLDHCMQAAQMIYDVHWAAACMTHANQSSPGAADGHPECDLPDAKAAVVNAWLDEAQARCMAEANAR